MQKFFVGIRATELQQGKHLRGYKLALLSSTRLLLKLLFKWLLSDQTLSLIEIPVADLKPLYDNKRTVTTMTSFPAKSAYNRKKKLYFSK